MFWKKELRAAALGAGVLAGAACGGGERTKTLPPGTPQQTEPIFKPIDPAAMPQPPAAQPGSVPPPSTPIPGGAAEPMAMVTDLASGWPVNLRAGQSMVARLTVDRAAGMRWSLRPGTDGGVLTFAGEPSYETKPGTPSVEVFRLTAAKPGQTTLTFDYRKGSDATPLKSASYQVTVQ